MLVTEGKKDNGLLYQPIILIEGDMLVMLILFCCVCLYPIKPDVFFFFSEMQRNAWVPSWPWL